ncbi:MAG: helix-turn-helix domain-containing protein [Candidatus Binataceae bacterium]
MNDLMTVSIKDAAKMLGLSFKSCWDRVHRGEIPSRRVGRRILIDRSELQQWFLSQPSGSKADSNRSSGK